MYKLIKDFIYTVMWFWKNRGWSGTRQKYKAFDKDFSKIRVN